MAYRKHLLALCLVVACSGDAKTGSTDSAAAASANGSGDMDEQLADISSYRLTMDKVDRWMNAQRSMARQVAALSPAEREAFKARQEQKDDASDADMDEMVQRIESEPMMKAAVRDAGLSPREFTLLTMSMIQTGMATAVLDMRPNDNQDSLARAMKANMDNIRFMRENQAELTRKQQETAATLKAAGMDNDN